MSADVFPARTVAWDRIPQTEELKDLAALCDPDGDAVSFCYSLHSFSDRSHHTERVSIHELVRDQLARFAIGGVPKAVSRDLDRVLAMTEDIQRSPTRWRALYACDAQNILLEFDMPAPESAAQLNIARHFYLVPLLRAIQSCRQYRVVLIESGKARLFEVQGTEIREIPNSLPEADLTRRSEDSRVGWSKHVDGNVEHQERGWFRMLADELRKLPGDHGLGTLVLGCREDEWGELRPYFADLEIALMGSFHLPGFEISADDVLKESRPVFEHYEQERCRKLLQLIDEDHAHGVRGLNEVLMCLEAGRVQKLLLGELTGQTVAECGTCGHLQQKLTDQCTVCTGSTLSHAPADEALMRVALTQKTDILIFPKEEEQPLLGVAALLRY